jgi:hypothetical protein
MSNQTPAPNDDVPRTPAPEDAQRNDYGIDPDTRPESGQPAVTSEAPASQSQGQAPGEVDAEAGDTAETNRFSPDDSKPETVAERTDGKPTDADIDTDGG